MIVGKTGRKKDKKEHIFNQRSIFIKKKGILGKQGICQLSLLPILICRKKASIRSISRQVLVCIERVFYCCGKGGRNSIYYLEIVQTSIYYLNFHGIWELKIFKNSGRKRGKRDIRGKVEEINDRTIIHEGKTSHSSMHLRTLILL